MAKKQVQIIELFRTLDPAEQREIAGQLHETTVAGSFYDRMTPAQRAALDEGIAQAERGQVLPAEEVFDRLAKRFGFSEGYNK
jgi:predicted transcriptional regulator